MKMNKKKTLVGILFLVVMAVTNVPQTIRDAWADVYRLFDVSYNMNGS